MLSTEGWSEASVSVSWLSILLALAACLLFAKVVFDSRQAGLSHIPGPQLAKYTNLWGAWTALQLSRAKSGAAVARFSRDLQRNYGSVVRTGPKTVTILDPQAIPLVYGVRAKLDKGDSCEPFAQGGITTAIVAIKEEKSHATYRKLVANSYSMSSLKGYEPYIDEITGQWFDIVDKYAQSGQPMNISKLSHYYCFEVVAMLTMGEPLGFLKTQTDMFSLIQATSVFSWYICVTTHLPKLNNILSPMLGQPPIVKFAEKVVRARLAEDRQGDERPDFISHFIETHKLDSLMDERQIVISVVGKLLAGTLSPSSAMKELTRHLATHLESQKKLYEELLSRNVALPASFEAVQNLPYLEGIVREALRLHSQIVVRQERVAPAGGLMLPNGICLPAGTNVGALGQAMTLHRDVFGPDADEYKPERWMKRDNESQIQYDERRKSMERSDMTFGHGSRACIGKNLTLLELHKAVASLVLTFRFEAVGDTRQEDTFVTISRR